MGRGDLTDKEWEVLAELLPRQAGKRGRPRVDDRRVINGMLWILRTGAPWRDLPERYGSWKTVSNRFYRWQRSGQWQRLHDQLQSRADQGGRVEWEVHFVDSTSVRAHQHAAGAKGGTHRRKPWVVVEEATPRKSTSAAKDKASRLPST